MKKHSNLHRPDRASKVRRSATEMSEISQAGGKAKKKTAGKVGGKKRKSSISKSPVSTSVGGGRSSQSPKPVNWR